MVLQKDVTGSRQRISITGRGEFFRQTEKSPESIVSYGGLSQYGGSSQDFRQDCRFRHTLFIEDS
jgi:hypothetical protein